MAIEGSQDEAKEVVLANPLGTSDEDFMKMNSPEEMNSPENRPEPEVQVEEKSEKKDPEDKSGDEQKEVIPPIGSEEEKSEPEKKDSDPVDPEKEKTVENDPSKTPTKDPVEGGDPKSPEDKAAKVEAVEAQVNYEESYKKIMAPFKANGKTIELKNVDEAIGLMQMGANYTRKMQAIQPHRKMLMMLENNNLLDEGKLSYLIDLDKKDPEAIKKLIKDSGIDPLEIDTTTDPAYLGSNHGVGDEEVNFRTILDDVTSTPEGIETIKVINSEWDPQSKQAVWEQPELMSVFHKQREDGTYKTITDEMERQKTLGTIPVNMPFIEAYKTVGDKIYGQAGKGGEKTTEDTPKVEITPKEPLETRAAAPKSSVADDDKAAAASSERASPSVAKTAINPLAMSDDDFLKQMKDRV